MTTFLYFVTKCPSGFILSVTVRENALTRLRRRLTRPLDPEGPQGHGDPGEGPWGFFWSHSELGAIPNGSYSKHPPTDYQKITPIQSHCQEAWSLRHFGERCDPRW